jgi:hypothetical protein
MPKVIFNYKEEIMKHNMVKRAVALALSFTLVLALFAPIAVYADTAIFTLEDFEGQALTDDGQFVNNQGIQRMNWNTYIGSRLNIEDGILYIHSDRDNRPEKGFQFGEHYRATQGFQGTTGKEYRVVMDAAATSTAGRIHIKPDNHPAGVAQFFDLPTERTTFELQWTQVAHEHNNLQISADVDFQVYSITIYEVGTGGGSGTTATPVTAGLASWQDVLDTGLFALTIGHNTGNPTIAATDDGIVVSDREPTGANGEHHGVSVDLRSLRALGEGTNPEIVISGTVEGTSARMFAQFFVPPNPADGPDGFLVADIGADGSFSFTITNQRHGIPDWAGDWANMPWIGAHPRGDMTVNSVTIGGVDIREILGGGAEVVIEEDEPINLGLPAGVMYSLLGDTTFQSFAVGDDMSSFPDMPYLRGAGNFTASVAANPLGGNAIRFEDRAEEYAGLDVLWSTLNLDDGNYSIQVVGKVDLVGQFDPAVFVIAGASSPWGWVGEEEFPDEDTGEFTMVRTFTVEGGNVVDDTNGNIGGNIRIRPIDCTNDFTLYQVAIVKSGTAFPALQGVGGTTPTPTPTPPGNTTIVLVIGSNNATVNGATVALESPAFIEGGRTMVPVRFVSEAMGANVDWNGVTRTVTVTPPGAAAVNLTVGEALADDMGTPEIRDGRTFVPVRFVANAMGGVIDWNVATQTVTIVLGGGAAVIPTIPVPPPNEGGGGEAGDVSGVLVHAEAWDNEISSVILILGTGTDAWPFAAGNEEGAVAFTPERGATYRISYNVTNDGTAGWRLRWTSESAGWPNGTAADTAIVNDHSVSAGNIATVVPALFTDGYEYGETYTLVAEVTFGANETLGGLIGNLAFVGFQGNHAWTPNWVTVEKDGETILRWESEQ